MPPVRASNGPGIFYPVAVPNQQAACGQNGRRIFLGGHVPMPIRYRVPTAHRTIPSLPIVPGPRKPWSPEPRSFGRLEPYPNVRFLLRQRKYLFFWTQSLLVQVLVPATEVTPITGVSRRELAPLLRGEGAAEAESSRRQSWTHKPKSPSLPGWCIGLGNPVRESSLASSGFCVIRMRHIPPIGCDRTNGNSLCPHRLVRPRTSALQAENGGSNPPGDTKHIYPPVPPPVFCTRHKHGHATNLHILETAKIETGTLGKECWGTQRL